MRDHTGQLEGRRTLAAFQYQAVAFEMRMFHTRWPGLYRLIAVMEKPQFLTVVEELLLHLIDKSNQPPSLKVVLARKERHLELRQE